MCSYSACQAYYDITSTIRIADNVLFLHINDEHSDISLTLNPKQARRLGELLTLASEELEQRENADWLFGDIQVDILFDNQND